ncbi:MAG: o-succinylbenzoate--CoA ligase [Actinomycetales bacterium]|nr:o-succinylbenzoate--CoA ligase [Actinomycetales bacterium]
MPTSRELRSLPVPGGAAVAELFPALEEMLADRGPALLPVPANDPARTRLLVDSQRPGEPIDDRAALVVSTSGSTGTPKGAMLTADALGASAAATDLFLGGPGRWLLALPAHHIAGLQVMLRSLRAGYAPTVMDVTSGFDPAALPGAVESALAGAPRVYTSLVPGQLAKVLDEGSPEAVEALTRVEAILLGGAATAPGLLARASDAGLRVVRTYGMSETAGGCVYDGLPLEGVEVRIESDGGRVDGDRADDHPTGRVWLRGPQVALGYRNAPAHPAFARPGWFRTDDAGRIGPDGRLRILGRLDEAISVGGLTLLPQTVEDALRGHPAVVDVVVVGITDARLGARPVAAVTLRSPATAEDLRAHVRAELGAHSAPARVAVLTELPTLPGGKVDRRSVARAFADGTIDQ